MADMMYHSHERGRATPAETQALGTQRMLSAPKAEDRA